MTQLIGRQTPTFEWVSNYGSSAGGDADSLARVAGIRLDLWQRNILNGACAELPDGRWMNNEVCVIVGRQNGKGGILEARELAGVFLWNERLILHSAHQQRTSNDAFNRLKEVVESTPRFDAAVQAVALSKGEESITFKIRHPEPDMRCEYCRRRDRDFHIAKVRYMARSGSAGRGFTKSDMVVLDEAMILDDAPVAALLPTMSTQPNWQVWYTASQGDRRLPTESRVLGRVRRRGYRRETGLYFAEWAAHLKHTKDCPRDARGQATDPLDVRGDPKTWAKVNPSMNIVRPDGTIGVQESFLRKMIVGGGMAEWDADREHLGVGDYPSDEGWDAFAEESWRAALDETSRRGAGYCVGISTSFDQRVSSFSIASKRDDGMWHVETIKTESGWSWVAEYALALWSDRHRRPNVVVIDRKNPAADDVLRAIGGKTVERVHFPTAVEYPAWCAKAVSLVADTGELRHIGQDRLNLAVKHVMRVQHPNGTFTWQRQDTTVDVTPWDAATLAIGGVVLKGSKRAGRPLIATGGRRS
jgi:hypothetical protein